jgi:hypothetical protein
MDEANSLYTQYKTINQEAILTFDDEKLKQAIELREKYASDYLDYEEKGNHLRYINVLKEVLSKPKIYRKNTYNKLMIPIFPQFEPL